MDQLCGLGIRDTARRLNVLPLGSSIARALEEISPEEMFPIPNRQSGNGEFDQPWTRGGTRVLPASQRQFNAPPGPCPSAARVPRDATDSHNSNAITGNPELPAQELASFSDPRSAPCLPPQNTMAFDDPALSGLGLSPDLTRPQWGSTNAMATSAAGAAFPGYSPSTGVECPELNIPQWGSSQTMACSAVEDISCDYNLRTWLEGSNSSTDATQHLQTQPVH